MALSLALPCLATGQSLDEFVLSLPSDTVTNTWQLVPHVPKARPQNLAEQTVRAGRDTYNDKVYGFGRPVEDFADPKTLSYNFLPAPLPSGRAAPAPPLPPDGVVALGNFNSYDVVLSKSGYSIYTEMHTHVDREIYPAGTSLAGTTIDILIPGGVLATRDGKVLRFHDELQEYGLIPGHRYVLFLRYIRTGNFYLLIDSIVLDNDRAQPNSPDAIRMTRAGKWPYADLPERLLVPQLEVDIAEQGK